MMAGLRPFLCWVLMILQLETTKQDLVRFPIHVVLLPLLVAHQTEGGMYLSMEWPEQSVYSHNSYLPFWYEKAHLNTPNALFLYSYLLYLYK
jgi:hypothetical protein